MPNKKVTITTKPTSQATVDSWVATSSESQAPEQPKERMKRLTLDLPESLHRAIKRRAVDQGVAMVDMLRDLLEQHFKA
ncbi:MAG TPA: hypothetical protein V6D19_06545 [Stenomitos sp.]